MRAKHRFEVASARIGCHSSFKILPARRARLTILLTSLLLCTSAEGQAAELKKVTVEAFNRYAARTEARHQHETSGAGPFLWADSLPELQRKAVFESLRQGKTVMERLKALDGGKEIEIPSGLVHHWVALAFVPGATTQQAAELVLDYDGHAQRYAPDVEQSLLTRRDGNCYHAAMRFRKKKIITVVTDAEFEACPFAVSGTRATIVSRSTRIVEVDNAGQPNQRQLPEGRDGGYLWRLNTYWRFEAKDGGVYLQCETITLTRDIPWGVAWLVRGFVESIPRESITFTMEKTRAALGARPAAAPRP